MSQENNSKPAAAAMPRRGGGGRGGRHGALGPGEKAKDFKGSFLKLIGYVANYKWRILFAWALAIASTVLYNFRSENTGQSHR